jgi:tetratricopeptide (TPR) repeat protein
LPIDGIQVAWLDWEDEHRDDPGLYAGVAGPSLVTVLNAVQKVVIDAAGGGARAHERAVQAFSEYREGAARMPEYAARFSDVLAQAQRPGSPFTAQDAGALLKAAASAGLMVGGHPGGLLGLTPDQLATAAQAGGHLTTAAARAVTGKEPGKVSPQEYDLVTDPARELARRVAAAIAVAASESLMIMLDTGEVIGEQAWGWLRRVMRQTGPRVAWVIGARFESEAEAGFDSPVARFVQEIGDGRLVLMSPTRFDGRMIRDYLGGRPSARAYTEAQIDIIARFTRGLPLAVSFTATLLDQGQPVEDVCREIDDGQPSSVLSRLARRYLVHAEQQDYPVDDPRRDDVMKILGLALAFGDLRGDPELIAALWGNADPLAAFQDLARRHDFVLPVSRRLHDDVRDTLRFDLLDPYRRARARPINQRALALLTSRLADMRDRWPSVDDQVSHAMFSTTLLTALWHAFWDDNQAGLDLFIQVLPVLAIADPSTAEAAAAMTGQFEDTFNADQRRDLNLFTEISRPGILSEPRIRPEWAGRPRRRLRVTLPGLALRHPGPANDLGVGETGDRRIALAIMRARLQADGNDESVIDSLRRTAAETSSSQFRQVIGSDAQIIASRLIWAGHQGRSVLTAAGLAAAQLATEMLADNAGAWHLYAVALDNMSRYDEALAAYNRALDIDPDNASMVNNRVMTLREMGRLDEALAANDLALELSPQWAAYHDSRGSTLREMGRLDEALAMHDHALTLEPDNASIRNSRGITLREMGRLDEALATHDHALTLDPENAEIHSSKGITLHYQGRLEDALAAYGLALALEPDDAWFHSNRGVELLAMGRTMEALAALNWAVSLAPRSPGLRTNKALALVAVGDLDRALAEVDMARNASPTEEGEGNSLAGAILWHRGDMVTARDRFSLVKGRVTGCTPFRTAELEAIALCALGQPDKAHRHLLAAVPLRVPGDDTDAETIYDLLSDPPLPGIDRLREIVHRRG